MMSTGSGNRPRRRPPAATKRALCSTANVVSEIVRLDNREPVSRRLASRHVAWTRPEVWSAYGDRAPAAAMGPPLLSPKNPLVPGRFSSRSREVSPRGRRDRRRGIFPGVLAERENEKKGEGERSSGIFRLSFPTCAVGRL